MALHTENPKLILEYLNVQKFSKHIEVTQALKVHQVHQLLGHRVTKVTGDHQYVKYLEVAFEVTFQCLQRT